MVGGITTWTRSVNWNGFRDWNFSSMNLQNDKIMSDKLTQAWVDFACTGQMIAQSKTYSITLRPLYICRWPHPPWQQPGFLEASDIWWSRVSGDWHPVQDGDESGLCWQGQLLARNHDGETSALRRLRTRTNTFYLPTTYSPTYILLTYYWPTTMVPTYYNLLQLWNL